MKHHPPRIACRPHHVRVPPFLPVPLRARHDGWTPERQAAFLVALTASGSVSAAARKAGMTRASAYQLRGKPGAADFAAAWDAASGLAAAKPKLTPDDRIRAALEGRIKPIVWRGEYVAVARKTSNSALLGWLGQLDRSSRSDAR